MMALPWSTSPGSGGDPGQDRMGDLVDELRRTRSPISGGETRVGQYTGTKALMLAVLEDAIRCVLGSRSVARAEAECWFYSPRDNWPFSFTVVCHTLGLDPNAVRGALRRMKEKGLSGRAVIRRSRPNVRRTARLRGHRQRDRAPK
jgi:hypothetical protein